MRRRKRSQRFVLVLRGTKEPSAELEDALYEGGCDDAILVFRNNVGCLEFDRVGESFPEAVLSALEDVGSTRIGITVDHVEPGDLVNASQIGRRLGVSREYVRLLIQGKRGKGSFPVPTSGVSGPLTLWSWAEVVKYLYDSGVVREEEVLRNAEFIRAVNSALWFATHKDVVVRSRTVLVQTEQP